LLSTSPSNSAYRIEQVVLAKHLTGLRLILGVVGAQYVFIDTASGDRLRLTGIPLRKDKLGNMSVWDEDVLDFERRESKRET